MQSAKRRRGLVQPCPGRLVELRTHLVADAGVVVVEPGEFVAVQHVDVDQPPVDRRQRQRLERIHRLFGACDFGLDHQFEIFDADAVGVGLVVAGLVGQDHARSQRRGAEL